MPVDRRLLPMRRRLTTTKTPDRESQAEPAGQQPKGCNRQDKVFVRRHTCLRTSIDAATTHARQPSAPIPVPTAARKLMKVGGERIRATKQMTAPSGSQSPPQGSKRRQPRFPPLVRQSLIWGLSQGNAGCRATERRSERRPVSPRLRTNEKQRRDYQDSLKKRSYGSAEEAYAEILRQDAEHKRKRKER